MSKTNMGLVSYAKAQIGNPYWWGTFGQYGTIHLYEQKKKQYPEGYTWAYDNSMDSKKVHDCSGLIKGYLMCENEYSTPIYNPSFDLNSAGLYMASKEKGHISDMPEIPGLLVFYDSLGHVGVYAGNGNVIQAANVSAGVIQTSISTDPHWTYWAKCPYVHYDEAPKNDAADLINSIRSTLVELISTIDKLTK